MSRPARASWGDAPSGSASLLLPEGVRAERCLEVFLYGGLGPFESFYVVPEYGRSDDRTFPNQQWHLFEADHDEVFEQQCGLGSSASWLLPWAVDTNGMTVNLGPIVAAFRDRPDLLARMRVVVMQHTLEPHEAAIPLSLSGFRLGNVRMCGMGAHVQRYFQERDGGVSPKSYAFTPATSLSTDNLRAATSVGLHPGSARPLGIRIGPSNDFPDLLRRDVLGDRRATVDALRAHLDRSVAERYVDPSTGGPLRSRALTDHLFAVDTLANSPALAEILTPELFARSSAESCGKGTLDLTGMSLNAAIALLTHPTDPIRYANVVDGGLIPAEGGGTLDTHGDHLRTHARNLGHTLRQVADRIALPGQPTPGKLSLDDTMVIFTTDFGRTPVLQEGTDDGTNHHPYGYVQVVLGGPIGPDQAGVVGAIGPDGAATDFTTPSEFRAAMLAAMGFYPFSSESFAVGDVRDVGTEQQALIRLQERVLGRVS